MCSYLLISLFSVCFTIFQEKKWCTAMLSRVGLSSVACCISNCPLRTSLKKYTKPLNIMFKLVKNKAQNKQKWWLLNQSEITVETTTVDALNPLTDVFGERERQQPDRRVKEMELKRAGGQPCLYMHGWWKNVSPNGSQLPTALRTAKTHWGNKIWHYPLIINYPLPYFHHFCLHRCRHLK